MAEHVLLTTGIRRLGSEERGCFQARIARSHSAKVQAVGYDSAGRLQYLYHPKYRERKEREKFERILRFSETLPWMRRITSEHLRRERLDREKVFAAQEAP